MAGFGFLLLILSFFGFITGIIMTFFSKIRKYGLKTILASLVVLIIGISICSMSRSPFGNENQYMEESCNSNLYDWQNELKKELKSNSLKKEFYSEIKDMKSKDDSERLSKFHDFDDEDNFFFNLFSKKIESFFETKQLIVKKNMPSVVFNKKINEQWENEVFSSFKLINKVYYVQGVISSTDSTLVFYSGFVDFIQNKFYLDHHIFSKAYVPFNESDYECIFSNTDKNYLNLKCLNLKERKNYFALKMKDNQKISNYYDNKDGLMVRIIVKNDEIPVYAFIENNSSEFNLKPTFDFK